MPARRIPLAAAAFALSLLAPLASGHLEPIESGPAPPGGPLSHVHCEDDLAAGFACHHVDLLAHLPLSTFGAVSANDVWGWTSGAGSSCSSPISPTAATASTTIATASSTIPRTAAARARTALRSCRATKSLAFGPDAAPLAHRNCPHREDVNLTGELADGTPFEGCDAVRSLPACGIGFALVLIAPLLSALRRRRNRVSPWQRPQLDSNPVQDRNNFERRP